MNAQASTEVYNFYADADLSSYAGEWVAIIEKKVVAHSKNIKSLMKKVKEAYPNKTPFVAKVPSRESALW